MLLTLASCQNLSLNCCCFAHHHGSALDVLFTAALMQPQSEIAVIQWVVMAIHLSLQVYDYFTFNIDVFKGQIQAYDPQKFNVGIAKESGLVPLLLAPIWLLFPYLQVSLSVQFDSTDSYCLMQISYVVYRHTCSSAFTMFCALQMEGIEMTCKTIREVCPHHAQPCVCLEHILFGRCNSTDTTLV